MQLRDRVVVVTGGANGIGRALCRRFARESPRGLVIADLDEAGATAVAAECGGVGIRADVAREDDVRRVAALAMERFAAIDLFCSNAGISIGGGEEVGDGDWARIWGVNVQAHIYAARAALPAMLARGEGYLLQTVSAAGLLTAIGSAPYSVTKHAALAFAEWLAITYGGRGIRVSALCPQGVKTGMLFDSGRLGRDLLLEGAVEPEQVAEVVVEGLAAERFLILPHPEVTEYFRRKAADYDRWLRGMRRLRERID
jgi:NAD(P)-dependent dehydrogenase (short-subunit alcohol dehydrogenase family)